MSRQSVLTFVKVGSWSASDTTKGQNKSTTQQNFADVINHPHVMLVGDFYRDVTGDGDEGWDWSSQETQYGYQSRSRFPRYELLEQTSCVLKAAVDEQVAAKHWKSSRGLFAVVAYNGLPHCVVSHLVTQPQDN